MQRYETDVRDGVLYLQAPSGAVDAAGHAPGGTATVGGAAGEGDGGEAGAGDADDADDDADPEWIEIGPMDDVVELIGTEEYVLQYDERQRAVGWLDTDDEGRLSFDVRETIRTTDFDDEFAGAIAGAPAGETTEAGYPTRVAVFADMLTTIWDAKGHL